MRRLLLITGCLLTGLIFAAAPWFMPFEMCAESCPDWLAISGFIFYAATPAIWLLCGLIVSRETVTRKTRLRILSAITVISFLALALFVAFGTGIKSLHGLSQRPCNGMSSALDITGKDWNTHVSGSKQILFWEVK